MKANNNRAYSIKKDAVKEKELTCLQKKIGDNKTNVLPCSHRNQHFMLVVLRVKENSP